MFTSPGTGGIRHVSTQAWYGLAGDVWEAQEIFDGHMTLNLLHLVVKE